MLTFQCGHRHSRAGAIACALRPGRADHRRIHGTKKVWTGGAEPLVECALTAIEEVLDGARYDGAQSEVVSTIDVPAREGVSDEEEMRALDRLVEELRRDEGQWVPYWAPGFENSANIS